MLCGPLGGLGFPKEAIPTVPMHLALAFVGQDLVSVLTLEIKICGSRTINQVRLDSLAKWPSAKSEKNKCWTFFFFFFGNTQNPTLPMSQGGLLEGHAGWSPFGIFAGLNYMVD